MAGRYVKLDDVMDAIGGVPKKKDSPYPTPIHLAAERIINKIKERIAKVPTADVVKVKHGEWIDDGDCFHCSVCNKTYNLGSLQTIYDVKRCWKYCANCGAKMDGKDTNVSTK